MNLFRNLLIWILLAIVGALAWQLLSADPGYVLVRYRGTDYTTTVLWAATGLLLGLLALWLLWTLVALPWRALRERRDRHARARLGGGLLALHQGHYARAEKLLAQIDNDDERAVARIAASQAALGRGHDDDAAAYLNALGDGDIAARAIASAELALAQGRPTDALVALDAPGAQPLPPRGLALRADALAVSGRYADAYGLLGALRQQQAVPDARLSMLEADWAAGALRQAADASVLADTWEALPKPLRVEHTVVAAYADRAAALGWEDAATGSVEHALDARWDEGLAARYGNLPVGRVEHRQQAADRWLQAHPASPALLVTLARLARARGQWPQAEDYLQRALAHGGGADAWEEIGHARAGQGDEAGARAAYANALRAGRGEPVMRVGEPDLRQSIHDQPVIEERDAHGMPRLRE